MVIFVPVSFMSSISGRFLYQFGITAAVAILVSLLVSFTLTPMMSARLLLRRRRGHGGGHDAAQSRSGFYGHIDRVLHRHARLVDARIAAIDRRRCAVIVALPSVPLYSLVQQEFVPSDVDEGEFEVQRDRAARARAWPR